MTDENRTPACQMLADLGLTQDEIADVLECSQPNVSAIMAGRWRPDDRRKAIAKVRWGIPFEAWLPPSMLEKPQSHPRDPLRVLVEGVLLGSWTTGTEIFNRVSDRVDGLDHERLLLLCEERAKKHNDGLEVG